MILLRRFRRSKAFSQGIHSKAETAVLCRKNGAYNARIVQLYMHPCRIQKPKVIPLSVFKLENICLKQEKTVTALAKLSAQASCSISQRIPKSKASGCPLSVFKSGNICFKAGKKGNDAAKLPAHDLPTIMCTAHTGSPKQGPRAVGRVQLNVHANFHGCLKQEKRKRSSQSSLRMHCVHKIPKPRPSSCWPHPINVNFHSCVRQETQ